MRIRVLREEYCARCPFVKRSPRSTGVRMFLEVYKERGGRVLDFGCSNWRNSRFLEGLGFYAVRMDAMADTRPDVVAYPTHMPFRDKAFDAVLLTHVLMFLEDKSHWGPALQEAARCSRGYVVVETYHVKNGKALRYTNEELVEALAAFSVVRRNVRPDMQNFVLSVGGRNAYREAPRATRGGSGVRLR